MSTLLKLVVLAYAWRTRHRRRPRFSVDLGCPTAGTWTITYLGHTTRPIPYDATLESVQVVCESEFGSDVVVERA